MWIAKHLLLISVLCFGISLDFVVAKSITQTETTQQRSVIFPEGSPPSHRSTPVESRRVVTSWNDQNGMWQGAARLPSSSQTGGNDYSRYKISRDGSLSIAYQGKNNRHNYDQNNDNRYYDRKVTPTELRSFSVVLSDVDVIGNYDEPNAPKDSYSQSGVSSYNIHSSSIHRMNASWKLNQGSNSSPTSQELLKFLSLFTANETSTIPNQSHSKYQKKLQDFPSPLIKTSEIVNADHPKNESLINDPDLLPFTTWFESSRNIQSDNETTTNTTANTSSSDVQFNGNQEKQVILQELISVLEKLNETSEDDADRSRSARGIILGTKDENDNSKIITTDSQNIEKQMYDSLNDTIRSSSDATTAEGKNLHEQPNDDDESTEIPSNSSPVVDGTEKMIKITNSQQTATYLKKLISNLIKSDGGNMEEKSGAEIVNILVSPDDNNNDEDGNSETRQSQKVLFLKTHDVKKLLETTLSDPSASEAAHKIAAALHVPSISDRGFNYFGSGNKDHQSNLNNITTPDGFPLTGQGFLNLHHPNLQFHQALHHLVANGSAPTSISATTKTNVINIFVINFNNSPNNPDPEITGLQGLHKLISSGIKNKNQNEETKLPIPLEIKPILLESVHEVPYPAHLQHLKYSDSMGRVPTTAEPPYRRVPHNSMPSKMYKSTTTNVWSQSTPSTQRPNKIHILDLLPGDINKFTSVQYGPSSLSKDTVSTPSIIKEPQTETEFYSYSDFLPDNSRNPTKSVNSNSEMASFAEFMNAPRNVTTNSNNNESDIEAYLRRGSISSSSSSSSTRTSTTTTDIPLPPGLAHVSWIFRNESPPKPNVQSNPVRSQKGEKSESINTGMNYDDPDFPDSADQGDSMMETDETANLPFQNFHRVANNIIIESPVPSLLNNGTKAMEVIKENSTDLSASNNETLNTTVLSTPNPPEPVKLKPPAFTLFATKIPEGGFVDQTEPGTDNTKLKKLMTALGYSAMPTLAAGVAATWPYWVPLVAAGRRRKRRALEEKSRVDLMAGRVYPRMQGIDRLDQEEVHSPFEDHETKPRISKDDTLKNSTESSSLQTKGEEEAKSTKNEEPESANEKWIKIKVITEPSPTFLPSVKKHKNSNNNTSSTSSSSSSTDNHNNRLLLGNGEPQDTDVPLLKNFLKNVLTNEWSISATADSSNLNIQQHSNTLNPNPNNKVHSYIDPFPSTKPNPTKVIIIKPNLDERDPTVYVDELLSSSSSLPETKLPTNNEWETFQPSGQNISLLITPIRKNEIHTKLQKNQPPQQTRRNKVADAIQLSQDSYAAAALLPICTKTDLTNGRTIDTDTSYTNSGRNNRRLHKLKKTEEISDETESENEEDGTQLAQSLSAISSHLLDTGDDSLENSSERDIYINKNEDATSTDNDTDEALSDEDSDQQAQENGVANPTVDPKTTSISTWHDGNDNTADEDKMIEKQKSDNSPTTPKGLTTWSAVNGGSTSSSSSSSNYLKGSVQKLPSDYTVSGGLLFSTDRPTTAAEMIVIKDRSTFPTTEIPRTTKANNSVTKSVNRRKPYNKNKKVVQPSKFVKPPLEEVTAEAIGSDATHTIYKTRVTEPVQSKISTPTSSSYNPYATKKPLWPYQMPAKKIVTTRRPVPFSRVTAKPKNPYAKRPQNSVLTLTTPTTTTPASTTVYHRNPGSPIMYPFPSISFTNMGFMDFLRSQIIPRIGLSLISFMAASPLILSMLGASAVGRRKKRDLGINSNVHKATFESIVNFDQLPKFDFSTIKRKLEKIEMVHKKKKDTKNTPKQLLSTFTEMLDNFFHSKTFSILKNKLVNPVKRDGRKHKNL